MEIFLASTRYHAVSRTVHRWRSSWLMLEIFCPSFARLSFLVGLENLQSKRKRNDPVILLTSRRGQARDRRCEVLGKITREHLGTLFRPPARTWGAPGHMTGESRPPEAKVIVNPGTVSPVNIKDNDGSLVPVTRGISRNDSRRCNSADTYVGINNYLYLFLDSCQ